MSPPITKEPLAVAGRDAVDVMVPAWRESAGYRHKFGQTLVDHAGMDAKRATELLNTERQRVEGLLAGTRQDETSDVEESKQTGDIADPAERLTAEEGDQAVIEGLQARLAAIARAEDRLANGTYGRSVQSGAVIPDERLEADPAAELTVEEASEA
jgi:DnaK suppressor protein